MIIAALQILSLVLIGLNLFWLHWSWLGIIAAALFFVLLARQSQNWLYAALASLAWLSIIGTFFYYTYKLSDLTIFISVATLPLAFRWLKLPKSQKEHHSSLITGILATILFGLLAIVFWIGRTGETIVSPWPQVHPIFFVLFFALAGIAFLKNSKLTTILLAVAASSVALFIYKNGFGFDAFTHQAAETYIRLHGAITPKTFYYIGHYALVVIINALTNIPIATVDSLLVPVMALGLLATVAYQNLQKYAALFLLLPFSYFILTTPFSLALALFVILLFIQMQAAPLRLQLFLALSTFCIHPIVGVPALFTVLWLAIPNDKKNYKILLGLLGAVALPILFITVGKFSPHWPTFDWPIIFDRRYDFWLDLVHLFDIAIVPAIVMAGWYVTHRRYGNHLALFFIFAASGILTKTLVIFPNIISYEQDSFADRLLSISLFFLFVPLLGWLKEKISTIQFSSRLAKGLFFAGLAIAICFGTYVSYPRKDIYAIGKGWSVGEADFHAVEKIEADAGGVPYIVLANQATSAAALKTFGFRYIKQSGDEFFFYPLPTSGRLYQYYLDLVYGRRGRAALLDALQYANVHQGYFAVSNYWWNAAKIKKEALTWADGSFDIDDGKITVFKVKSHPAP